MSGFLYTYSGEALVVMDTDVSTSLNQLLNTLLVSTECIMTIKEDDDDNDIHICVTTISLT